MSSAFLAVSAAPWAVAAAGTSSSAAYPGPAPWDGRAWAGAVLYLLLFAASLAAILRMAREEVSP